MVFSSDMLMGVIVEDVVRHGGAECQLNLATKNVIQYMLGVTHERKIFHGFRIF